MSDAAPTVKSIFGQAMELDSPEERAAFLDRACRDASIRAEVDALLAALDKAGQFMAAPPAPPTIDEPTVAERPGVRIGPYRLMEQIGEGGFGLVFVAEQQEPVRRKVALKVIKPGMDSAQIMARFSAERQALALMDHPNIARVLDAGATDTGRPYFVMELVRGIPITEYCDQNHLAPRERLELFVSVCQAVQHAHQKGIIHRDLKPSNILVTSHDGKPVAKVIDFGVAKAINQQLTERTIYTNFAQMIGTPLYMSPEQAEMSGLDIDTRSDVYSLGVLLYELLTGTTPLLRKRIATAAYDEIRRMIREEEPQKPSTRISQATDSLPSVAAQRRMEPAKLSRFMRGDLDWITMKALEKDRTRRYETASGLARDVERYLNDEAVEACPPSVSYRLRKFVRRNKGPVVAASVLMLALTAGIVGTSFGFVRADAERRRALEAEVEAISQRDRATSAADAERDAKTAEANHRRLAEAERDAKQDALGRAEWHLYFNRINLAFQYWQGNNLSQADRLLAECPKSFRNWEWNYLHRLCHADSLTLPGNGQFTTKLCFSKDGKRMAAVADTGNSGVRVWDLNTNKPIRELNVDSVSGDSFNTGAISPDGNTLAMGDRSGAITLWDVASGQRLKDLGRMSGLINSLDFSPDGKWLAAARTDDKRGTTNLPFLEAARHEAVKVWNLSSGQEIPINLPGTGVAANFSPDGKRLLTFKRNPGLRFAPGSEYLSILVDTATWKEERELGVAISWNFNSDGSLLILGKRDTSQSILKGIDPATSEEKFKINVAHDLRDIAISPNGRFLAVASWPASVNIWGLNERRLLRTLRGHKDPIHSIAFSPDGRLASCSWDNTIKFWNPALDQAVLGLPGKGARVATDAAFSPDGAQVAWVQGDNVSNVSFGLFAASGTLGTVTLWDAERGKIVHDMKGHSDGARRVAFSADGSVLASGARDRMVRTWNVATGQAMATFRGHDGYIEGLAVSADGRWVASGHEPKEITESRIGRSQFKRIPGAIKVWDAQSGQEKYTFTGHPDTVYRLAFNSDGRLLASYSHGVLKLWDLASGKERMSIPSNTGGDGLVFSPDGTELASVSQAITFWDVATGKQRLVLSGHGFGRSGGADFSQDGRRLVTGRGREVKLWDVAHGQEILTLPLLEGERPGAGPSVVAVSFGKDDRRILAAMYDGTVQCWDAPP